jgi:growth hormone secretagogue receptor
VRVAIAFVQHNIYAALMVIGVTSNLLTVLILTQKRMRTQVTSVYFCGLAVADSFVLIIYFAACTFDRYVEPLCHYYAALLSFAFTASSFLIIILTAERAIVVWFPLKAKSWVSRKKAGILVASSFLVAFCLYLPRIFYKSPLGFCLIDPKYHDIYYWQIMITYTLAPSFVLLFFNSAIAIRLKLRNKSNLVQTASAKHEAQSRRATKVVFVISSTYMVLNLPSVLFVLLMRMGVRLVDDPDVNDFVLSLVGLFLLLNHAANFWLYLVTSSGFRNTLCALLFCRRLYKGSEDT